MFFSTAILEGGGVPQPRKIAISAIFFDHIPDPGETSLIFVSKSRQKYATGACFQKGTSTLAKFRLLILEKG